MPPELEDEDDAGDLESGHLVAELSRFGEAEPPATPPPPEEAPIEPPAEGDPPSEPAADPSAQSTQPPGPTGQQTGQLWDSIKDLDPELAESVRQKYQGDTTKALSGLVHAYRKVGERDELAQIGKLLKDDPAGVYERLAQVYGREQAQQPTAQQSTTPEWRPEWERFLERDKETGEIVAKAGAPPGLVEKYAAWQEYSRDRLTKLISNPEELIAPLLEAKLAEQRQQLWQEFQASQQQQMAAIQDDQANWAEIQARAAWMFNGGEIKPGNYTPAGKMFTEGATEAARLGITNREAIVAYAENYVKARTTPAPAKPRPATTKQATVGTGVPPSDDDWVGRMSLAEHLADIAKNRYGQEV